MLLLYSVHKQEKNLFLTRPRPAKPLYARKSSVLAGKPGELSLPSRVHLDIHRAGRRFPQRQDKMRMQMVARP
ncbi:hypothetical protein VTJ04DRAFT_3767 [Mycothermus thermophilus]|uniref:uncharacterized protein n=1 Tax=Humicola insolens TaxID=85995 RepID=UPI0037447D4A